MYTKEVTDSYLSTPQETWNSYVTNVKSYIINSYKFYYNKVSYYKNNAQKTHEVLIKYYYRVKTHLHWPTYMLNLQSLINQPVYNISNN